MNSIDPTIQTVLADVRCAYRLLHDYQRLAMDAVNYLGTQLQMRYAGGYPKFSDPMPQPGKDSLEHWAWDWLNMMLYEFHFESVKDNPWVGISILLISDTGYFCSPKDKVTATDTGHFLPSHQAETLIGVILSAKSWVDPAFMLSRNDMRRFIEKDGEMPPKMGAAGMVAKCYPFSRIATQAEADSLIDEIVQFAEDQQIPLERRGIKDR